MAYVRDYAKLTNAPEPRPIDDFDRVFDAAAVTTLACVAELPADADLVRLRQNLVEAARMYRQAIAGPSDSDVRREIADLWRAANRVHPDHDALAARLEKLSGRAQQALAWHSALPNPTDLRSPDRRDDAVAAILRACSFGAKWKRGRKRKGRREDAQEHSWSFVPFLMAPPAPGKGRPRAGAERELLQWVEAAYVEAGAGPPPKSVSVGIGPFYRFVRDCFTRIGAPSGNLRRLIEEREQARRPIANRRASDDPSAIPE